MSLPPLANIFALRSADAGLLDRIERLTRDVHPRRVVRRPSSAWIVIFEDVPPTVTKLADDTRLFFAEGRDRFTGHEEVALSKAPRVEASLLARRDGDFGFLHVGDDKATFVRSCGGRVPLYMRREPTYVALATTLTDLVRFVPDEVTLDPLPNAMWLLGWPMLPESRTFFREIKSVPRGHVVGVESDGGVRIDRYWDPRPPSLVEPTDGRRREHIERCRDIILGTLSRELDPSGHNLLTLSGGVDSSALAALAVGTFSRPVSTLSFVPEREPELSHEMKYIENLRNHYRFERTWEVPLDYAGRIDAARSAPSVALPVVHPALGMLPRILDEHPVKVLFGGEFADQVCGSRYTVPDWYRHTSLLELVRHPGRWPKGWRTAPGWLKHRLRALVGRPFVLFAKSLPDFATSQIQEEYLDWRADRQRTMALDRLPLPYLDLHSEQDGFVAMNWEVTTALGVRRVWPFFTREMLELAFDCHPSELVGPGTKRLLQAALDGYVPPMNLYRETLGTWRSETLGEPAAPPVPEGEEMFDLARLPQEEARLGIPISWVLRRFLDGLGELREPALFRA